MWFVYFLAVIGGITILISVIRVVVLVDRIFNHVEEMQQLVNEIRQDLKNPTQLKEDQSQSQSQR